MRRVTKIVLGVTTIGLLATSAFAYSCQNSNGCMSESNKCQKMMKMKHHKKNHGMMGIFSQLNLTDAQKEQIKKIRQEARDSINKPSKAFTASEFNKAEFIKLVKEQKEARIEKTAQTIEKIYAVLNTKQKQELKTLLDKKANFKGGMDCDKNCNGRG